jgi:hypothetical protein
MPVADSGWSAPYCTSAYACAEACAYLFANLTGLGLVVETLREGACMVDRKADSSE